MSVENMFLNQRDAYDTGFSEGAGDMRERCAVWFETVAGSSDGPPSWHDIAEAIRHLPLNPTSAGDNDA